MDNVLSRRGFIKKTALAVVAAAMSDLSMIAGAEDYETFAALAAEPAGAVSHVSVKLWPGRSQQTLQRLADAITDDVVNIIGCRESNVSVAIEEIASSDWKTEIYDPEIRGKALYRKPGYSM
jgi:4-oxalocrotonate tautomerase